MNVRGDFDESRLQDVRVFQLGAKHELFIVTLRKRRGELLEQLVALDLVRHFRCILSEPNNDGTPEVKCRLIASQRRATVPGYMIGDTELDLTAGKRLGLSTVAVCSGIRTQELLQREAPDLLFPSVAEFVLFAAGARST